MLVVKTVCQFGTHIIVVHIGKRQLDAFVFTDFINQRLNNPIEVRGKAPL